MLNKKYLKKIVLISLSCFFIIIFLSTLVSHVQATNDPCDSVTSLCPINYEDYVKATSLSNEKKYDEAIAYYDRILARNPNNVQVLTNKCYALESLKHYNDALQCIDKAILIDPKSAWGWFLFKGNIYFSQQKYDKAIQAYDSALEIRPGWEYAIINKQAAQEKMKQFDESPPTTVNPALGFVIARSSSGQETQQTEQEKLPYTYIIQRDGNQVGVTLSNLNRVELISKDEKGNEVGYRIPLNINDIKKGDQITIKYDDPIAWFGLGIPVGYFKIEIDRKTTAWFPGSPKLKFRWRSEDGQQGQGISGENSIESMGANIAGYPYGTDTLTISVSSLGKDWFGIGNEINQADLEIRLWVFNSKTYAMKVFSEAYEKSEGLAAISALSG
jgi:tetratricopeptide (TPR) repeat protein